MGKGKERKKEREKKKKGKRGKRYFDKKERTNMRENCENQEDTSMKRDDQNRQ